MYNSTEESQALLSTVSVVSLLATAAYALIGWILAVLYKDKVSKTDFWVLIWLVYDVLIHLTLVRRGLVLKACV